MKYLLATFLIGILTWLCMGFGPWWIIAVIAFGVVIVMRLTPGAGFLAGFTGVFVTWAACAWWIDMQNDSLLSARIGELFGSLSPVLMIIVTGLLGGLVGAVAGITGAYASRLARKRRQP